MSARAAMHLYASRAFSAAGIRPGPALVLLAACVVAAVAAWQNYRAIDRALTEVALSRRVGVAQLAAATLSEKFERLTDLSVSLATRVRFSDLVAAGRWTDAVAILGDVPKNFPFIERVFLSDPDATLQADLPEAPGVRGVNFAERDWYRGVTATRRPYVSPVYRRMASPQINVFAVSAPVHDKSGAVRGILVLQVRVESLFEWLKQVEMEPEDSVYVVDPKGQIAFHSRYPGRREIVKVAGNLSGGAPGVEIAFDPVELEEAITARAVLPSRGWMIVMQQPTRSATALVARDRQLRLLMTGYALFAALCIAIGYLVWQVANQRRHAEGNRKMTAELERRVEERTRDLTAANKELETFSYSVSHDLRAPLRAVIGYSKLLVEDHGGAFDADAQRKLDVIRGEAERMGVLINELLAFSRLGRKQLSIAEVDMAKLAQATFDAANDRRDGTQPEFRLGALPGAKGDRLLLGQVWANLLSNAIKYSSKRQHPVIEVSATAGEDENTYRVRDNGAGFDPRYQAKLFGVFQRLHNADDFPGTGVGLALAQRIVERHGGRIWAESRPDEGATFYFTLPTKRGHLEHGGRVREP